MACTRSRLVSSQPLVGSSSAEQVKSSTDSQAPSTGTNNDPDNDIYCHCPFKCLDNFHDGIRGSSYVKTSILKHIHD